MASNLIPFLSQGPRSTVAPADALKTIQDAATIRQTQAQTGLVGAEAQQAQAAAQLTQAQAAGAQAEAALKQREVDAKKSLSQLLQQNSVKNPDGSIGTDMPSVIAQYQKAGYPDYALALQKQLLDNQKLDAEKGKAVLEYQTGKTKLASFAASAAGFTDPNMDPQKAKAVFPALYDQATKGGYADMLGISPQEFNQNPAAGIARLSQLAQTGGQAAEALNQQKLQLEAAQGRRAVARTDWVNLLNSVDNPADYSKAVTQLLQNHPEDFNSLGITPVAQVKTPQELDDAKRTARFAAMPAGEQQAAVTAERQQQSLQHMQAAEAGRAGAEAGLARAQTGLVEAQTQTAYGVDTKGNPVIPASSTNTNAPTVNPPGKAPMDLSKDPNWTRQPPAVQRAALNLLSTGSAGPVPDPNVASMAMQLANKVDPQWSSNAPARQKLWESAQPLITAVNTAVAHSVDLESYAHQLGPRLPQFLNTRVSDLRRQFGNEIQSAFENQLNTYQAEVAKYNEGAGVLTVSGKADQAKTINNSQTIGQVLSVIRGNNRMMGDKSEEINTQYNKQLGGNILGGGVDVLQPKTRQILASQEPNAGSKRIRVQIPGQPAGEISASKLERFKRDHPNAVIFK